MGDRSGPKRTADGYHAGRSGPGQHTGPRGEFCNLTYHTCVILTQHPYSFLQMWFVCLHAIHHYALARVILVHELGLQINDSFGVAPSTLVMRLWRQASQERSKL